MPEDRRVVYANEIEYAIRILKVPLGTNQPANFAKDFLRHQTRNSNWPKSLSNKRWCFKQLTGSENHRARNFIWLPYTRDQVEPFPDQWPIPSPPEEHRIQSVTISIPSKQIERLDEPRLMQIVVDLRIVETHFALYSPISTADYKVVHIDHLQTGMKLRRAEIDGLYLAQFEGKSGTLHPVLITVEAKKHDEYILSSQVTSQVEHASELGVTCEQIIPIALKHADGGVWLFEFKPFALDDHAAFEKDSILEDRLKVAKTIFYRVLPEMIGLSRFPKRRQARRGRKTRTDL